MLRMVNPKQINSSITAKKDRHFKGYSLSNRTSRINKHTIKESGSQDEPVNQTGGSATTRMSEGTVPIHDHYVLAHRTGGVNNSVRRSNVFTTQNAGHYENEPKDGQFRFDTQPWHGNSHEARNNMPAYRVLTYIIKL